MRRWLKIAVPLGIAAVLVAVLAIGFGSPRSDAVTVCEASANTSTTSTDVTGRVSPGGSASYTMNFCSDPADYFVAWVSWGNRIDPAKDLALQVTDPNGTQYVVDREDTAIEVFMAGPNLSEGTWQVEVINHGSRSVKYELSMGFG